MSERPNIEQAMKQVRSRYELVHAAVKRTLQLMEEGEDIFIRDRKTGRLIKKTFQAIQDIAEGRVKVSIKEENQGG
ncbi:DNA-directed RNA polymerase subunit omega [Thermocrinis minervae]|uniref:DNA-directed RNA polymerase subunit omega n=1 Tax=Thermocrinis minervae TaxID=381751 RepID=A0A1M6T416_9AQUI|nr:DNA-directed RNA polymerase subunit omega [Thermocrinis minervae]SHK51687.1 DNA-directed RNA polymerase subunit omega [Thermocrinis minervae]